MASQNGLYKKVFDKIRIQTILYSQTKHAMYKVILPENYVKPAWPGRNEVIAALKSGNYEQGTGKLRFNDKFCCLGVICELQGRLKPGVGGSDFQYGDAGNTAALFPDNPLYSLLGAAGYFPEGAYVKGTVFQTKSLMGCNDTLHLTFLEIAEIIEQIWEHADEIGV